MSWFWTMMLLILATVTTSESNLHRHRKSPAVIVGTVYCDTCFQQTLPKANQYFIAGASVAVECKDTGSRTRFRQHVKTDSHGEFKVRLPLPVSKYARKIRGCSVRLISSYKPHCGVAASATCTDIHFKSRKDGTSVFSAGFFTFRPLEQPEVCGQKASINKLSQMSNLNDSAFVPPIQDRPSFSFLPPLPRLPPLPQLPRLPPLPWIPFLPPVVPKKQAANNAPKSAENQPHTSPLPQNAFSPPGNPFQPPPITLPPILPLPPLFHSPPLLYPPSPLPLPAFLFQPTPALPGVLPAVVSAPAEKKSP